MKIWLDDIRKPPPGWTWVKTADECIAALTRGCAAVSLDHDLADEHYTDEFSREKTGYDVVCWLEENAQYIPAYINIHTMNPSGRYKMRQACERFNCRLTVLDAISVAEIIRKGETL